jgi:hypothetical protein
MFENRVFRRIFVSKRDVGTGGCRKVHNEELHNLYSSPSVIRMIKSRRMKPEGKTPLGRKRRRWVDNIKIDLREIGWGGTDWIDLAQDVDQRRALVYTVTKHRGS